MAGRYAAQTEVSSDRSRAEIERTLRKYGATAFAYGWEGNRPRSASSSPPGRSSSSCRCPIRARMSSP